MNMTITWLGMAAMLWLGIKFYSGFKKGFLKAMVSLLFSLGSLILVWMVNPYVTDFLKSNQTVYTTVHRFSEDVVEKTIQNSRSLQSDARDNLVNGLPLPKIIKDKILKDNTQDMYQYFNVSNFKQYVIEYLTEFLIKGIAFLISYFVIALAFSFLGGALDLMAKLPLIHGANKLLGGALGFASGLIVVWIVLLVITLLYNTSVGKYFLDLISKDLVVSYLYDTDVLIRIFMSVFAPK
ncbi:MAG: CvpA family protein [Clostridiales bacterium]|nr:CvpA family protein [Candidatus Blautia equi]